MAFTTTSAGIRYRYLGITDDCVTCQKCGKEELRSTVIIMPVDVDGNDEGDPEYYGSTCAARALGVRGGGKAVLSAARNAHLATLNEAVEARIMLDHYGLPHAGDPTEAELNRSVGLYADAHRNARWAPTTTITEWFAMVADMIGRKQTAITTAGHLTRVAVDPVDVAVLAGADTARAELAALGLPATGHITDLMMTLALAKFEQANPGIAGSSFGPSDTRPTLVAHIRNRRRRIYSAAHLTATTTGE